MYRSADLPVCFCLLILLWGCDIGKRPAAPEDTRTVAMCGTGPVVTDPELTYKLTAHSSANGSVRLSFIVMNHSNKAKKFGVRSTPFEDPLSDVLLITDRNGKSVPFLAAMAGRSSSPAFQDIRSIPAGDSISVTMDVKRYYGPLSSGSYRVTYTGGAFSGLRKGTGTSFFMRGSSVGR